MRPTRHLAILRRRRSHLRRKLLTEGEHKGQSYDRAELGALTWGVPILRDAPGLIEKLRVLRLEGAYEEDGRWAEIDAIIFGTDEYPGNLYARGVRK